MSDPGAAYLRTSHESSDEDRQRKTIKSWLAKAGRPWVMTQAIQQYIDRSYSDSSRAKTQLKLTFNQAEEDSK